MELRSVHRTTALIWLLPAMMEWSVYSLFKLMSYLALLNPA